MVNRTNTQGSPPWTSNIHCKWCIGSHITIERVKKVTFSRPTVTADDDLLRGVNEGRGEWKEIKYTANIDMAKSDVKIREKWINCNEKIYGEISLILSSFCKFFSSLLPFFCTLLILLISIIDDLKMPKKNRTSVFGEKVCVCVWKYPQNVWIITVLLK